MVTVGKWHNTPVWEISPAGPFDRWPTGLGFEYCYGFLGAGAASGNPSSIATPALSQHGVITGGCFPAASSLTGLGLALAKESSHGAVCWPGRIPEGDEPLRGGSNGHDPVARQVCVDT